jgi:hypothetical protein
MGAGTPAQAAQHEATFVARWISSRTEREALARMQVLTTRMSESAADQYVAQTPPDYQIVVFGPDMSPFQGRSVAALTKSVYLQAQNSKRKVAPDNVQIEHSPDSGNVTAVTFTFPKTRNAGPSLPSGEKQAYVVCELGTVRLSFSFDLLKMTDAQGQDL